MHESKALRAEFKVAGDDEPKGTVIAKVSAFGNVDYGGDRMVKGAFADTLAAWQAKGDPIPFIWSHQWSNPEAYVGSIDPANAKETDDGLEVKAQMFLDDPAGAKAYGLLQKRLVTQFSIGYEAKEVEFVDEDGTEIRELKAVDLFECGPCLLGMNPETELLEAASRTIDRAKAGRTLSAKNEGDLKAARDLIDGVLAAAQPADDEEKTGSRDTESKIDPEREAEAFALLTKTKHTEE